MSSIYQINKGVGRPVEFKGLRAQYIWYLGGGLVCLLIVFAILYICGVNTFVCLGLIGALTTLLFMKVYQMNRKYGQHGMMKMWAKRSVPSLIRNHSRKTFTTLKAKNN